MKSDAAERHRRILERLESETWIRNAELANLLEVTPMTVWRDLVSLQEKGLIRRSRGRISRVDARHDEPEFHVKTDQFRHAKVNIARYAADHLIQEGDSLAIDGGTTTAALVSQILPACLTILTNSLHIAELFNNHPSRPAVYCSGGFLRQPSGTFIGREALTFFKKRRANKYFLSASGVDAKQGVTDISLEDNEVKQAMANSSKEVILMADRSKVGHVSLMQVLPWRRVHRFITDAPSDTLTAMQAAVGSDTDFIQV